MSARGRVQAAAVTAAIVVLLGLLALTMMVRPAPAAQAQSSADCYRMAGGDKWICRSGGEFEFQTGSVLDVQAGATLDVAGALNVTGNSSFGGTVGVTDDFAISAKLNVVPADAITVTNAAEFTPTGAVQLIQAAGAVTPVLAAGSQGQVLTLVNISNQNVTIADTTGQLLSAAAVLGQWDTLTVVYYGVNWIEVARANN